MSSETPQIELVTPAETHGKDLTTGSIPRHLIAFTVPMLIGNVLQALYQLVNAFWVERFLGKQNMAAVTDIFPVFVILMAIAIGLTMASSILTSQAYGAKDFDRLRKIIENSVVLVGITSIICAFTGHYFADPLLRVMATDNSVLPIAVRYMQVFIWSMPFMFGVFLMGSLLRGVGDSRTPVYFQLAFLFVNTILDPVLMFGWLGLPKMGVNGTAVATIISQFGSLAAIIIYLRRKRHLVLPSMRGLTFDIHISWLTIKIGVPSIMQNAVYGIAIFVTVGLVNVFGPACTAGYGIASRIDQFAFLTAMSVGLSVSTLAGQNIGANRYDRVKQVFKWGAIIGWAITVPFTIIMVALPKVLMKPFVMDADKEVIMQGALYLRIVGAGYPILTLLLVTAGVINGAGKTFMTSLITLISLLIVRIPLAVFLSEKFQSPAGIWYAIVIGFAIGLVISLIYYKSGRWKYCIIDEHNKDPMGLSNGTACG